MGIAARDDDAKRREQIPFQDLMYMRGAQHEANEPHVA
jgi:hypothetical protein